MSLFDEPAHLPPELLEEQRANRHVPLFCTLLPGMPENHVRSSYNLTLCMQKPTTDIVSRFVDDFDCRQLLKAITSDTGELPTWFCSFTDSSNLYALFSLPDTLQTGSLPIIYKTPRLLHKPEIAEFEARWKGLDSIAAKKDLVLEYKNKRKLIDDVCAHLSRDRLRGDRFGRPLRTFILGRASRRQRGQMNWTRSERDALTRKITLPSCRLRPDALCT